MTHKVSIITVVYNNKATVESALNSVLSQDYADIEYIVVDGGSSDGTVEILNKYKDKISHLVSEQDNGIYDAMNKGLALATGDVIGILNSDDFYPDTDIIKTVAKVFNDDAVDCCYGDLEYVNYRDTDKVVRRWTSQRYQAGLFRKGWHPPHPTFFARRELFAKYGCFDVSLDISADYELMLRLLERYGVKSTYIPRVLVKMRNGGTSNRNLKQIARANWQCYKAWRMNGFKVSLATILKKPLSKILQYTNAKN